MLKLGLLSLMVALAAACGVYTLKHQVQSLELHLERTQDAIQDQRLALIRLKAEWATLTQPARLHRLAHAHLGLVPARPRQLVAVKDLPQRNELELQQRRYPALVSSGVAVPLRFKPAGAVDLAELLARPAERGRPPVARP